MGKRRHRKPAVRIADPDASPVIVWFRQDLRLEDNPALYHAVETGRPCLCVYISECPAEDRGWGVSGAARVWLHHALTDLRKNLRSSLGSDLCVMDASSIGTVASLCSLVAETGTTTIYMNRVYEPWRAQRDQAVVDALPD